MTSPNFLRKPSCWDGVRARNIAGVGLERKRKKVLRAGWDLLGLFLLKWLVLWFGQMFLVSRLLTERVLILFAEWISLEGMLKLWELSPAVSCVLKEWLDDQILDSFGDCGIPIPDSCIRTSFSVPLSQCECSDVIRIPVRFFLNM